MRLFTGLLLTLACVYAQEANLSRPLVSKMFDSKLTVAQRNDACYALRTDHAPETLQAMRKALKMEPVRPCAARNLAAVEAADLLADGVRDADPEVRATAARALGALRKPEFIELLASTAGDPNVLVAISATEGLCQYDDRRVLPSLKAIADKSSLLASISVSRLAELDGNEALPIARKWLAGTDVTERVIALRILGEHGDASDLPALRVVAEHKRELMAPQRGFGLMPAIDLAQAAKATIAQIEGRQN